MITKGKIMNKIIDRLNKEQPHDLELEMKICIEETLKAVKKEIEKARKEYNELRRFAGKDYPKGKCKNLLKLLEMGN